MIPDRASNAEHWETDRLIIILLRQFQRLLADAGVPLSSAQIQEVGEQAARHALPMETTAPIVEALAGLIAQSEQVLAGWSLTFAQSLHTEMDAMPDWQTTADFLQIANEKVNAEVRIGAGAALLLLLGDARHINYLLTLVDHDMHTYGRLDVDAVLARRALLHASGIKQDDPEWLQRVRLWADTH